METAPQLVQRLLVMVSAGLSPLVLVAAFIGVLILITKFRRQRPSWQPGRPPALRSPEAVRIARRMRRNKQTSLLLSAADKAGFSKLGGNPDYPLDAAWPIGPEGALRFWAQLDLGELRVGGGPEWLPPEGRLYVFFDERMGATDQVQVIFAPSTAALAARPAQDASAWPFHERRIAFVRQESLPSLDWLAEDIAGIELEDDELDTLVDMAAPAGPSPQHRIGGYPEEIQDEQMALSCERALGSTDDAENDATVLRRAVRTWKLLVQIDSDAELGTSFGDGGRLYVFVRGDDARRGEFSETVTLYQTS